MTLLPPAGPAVPPPPDLLECNAVVLSAGTVIHRIHDEQFGAAEFNPGKGGSRFAPFQVAGAFVPTAYGATSFECAAFESIFHDVDAAAPFRSIYWSQIEPLLYSRLTLRRNLSLASLFSADLIRFGLERRQLIDTHRSTNPDTRKWSPAIHEAPIRSDGIVWVSRRYDQDKALMLFGTRVRLGDFATHPSIRIATDPACLAALHEISQRCDIAIIR